MEACFFFFLFDVQDYGVIQRGEEVKWQRCEVVVAQQSVNQRQEAPIQHRGLIHKIISKA